MTDWVKAVHPELKIMWVRCYIPEWDGLVALPVMKESAPAKDALERGIIQLASPEEAQNINSRFADESQRQAEYLRYHIDVRWTLMKDQAKKEIV